MTEPAPDPRTITRVYRGNSRKPWNKPLVPGVMYRVETWIFPDNRWMAEARRIHTEYHRRRK